MLSMLNAKKIFLSKKIETTSQLSALSFGGFCICFYAHQCINWKVIKECSSEQGQYGSESAHHNTPNILSVNKYSDPSLE